MAIQRRLDDPFGGVEDTSQPQVMPGGVTMGGEQQAPQEDFWPDFGQAADTQADPVQDQLAAFRDGRAAKGIATNQTDADVFSSPDWKLFQSGQAGWDVGGEGTLEGWGGGAQSSAQDGQASQGGFQNPYADELMGALRGLFPGGGFNQNTVNLRTESARENLNRFGKSRGKSNAVALAERGLIGDGPEITAMNRLEEELAGLYGGAVRDIYADESDNADQRMLGALGIGGNIAQSQGGNLVDWDANQKGNQLAQGRLSLDRTLGTGQLALQNRGQTLDDDFRNRDLDAAIESGDWEKMIRLLELYGGGADTAAGGFIK